MPAADRSSAPPETSVAPDLHAAELKALADQLADETRRNELIATLRALAAARETATQDDTSQAEAAQSEAAGDPGAAIIDGVMAQMRRAGSAFAAFGALFSDLPALIDWARLQVENPKRRALWSDVLLKLGVTLFSALLLQALAHLLIRRPLAALQLAGNGQAQVPAQSSASAVWLQILFILLRALVSLIPIAVFAGAAYGILALLAPNALTRDLAQIVVLAFVAVYALGVVGDVLLAHETAPLHLDEESATYARLWLRRLAILAAVGYVTVQVAARVRIPPDAVDTIAKLAAFAFAALLAVLVLQLRQPVASWIRGSLPPSDVAPATPRSRPWHVLRQRIGDVWHVLALLYIVATYGVWAFEVDGGFRLILRGTLLTVALLASARLLQFTTEKGFTRLFAISPDTRQRFPGLEERANRYLPLLLGAIRALLYAIAAIMILQAWGIDSLAWIASETGRGVVARVITILLVVLVTIALWEAVAAGIEYYLTGGAAGQPTARSARARTLLPLLRRTVSIVLGLIAALIVLSELGINIAPLLAGAGVVGLAIGFGAQTLVKDVITGIFILTEDTVAVGDIVDLGGNGGVVEDISIRTIRLRDTEGIVHVIPFSEVTKIKNMTRGYAQALFDLGISYRENVDEVIEVIKALATEFRAEPEWNARILDDLEMWGVDQLADSAVVLRFRIKTLPAQQWSVRREFTKRIKHRFDELGIEIPFPHQTIYFGADKQGNAPPLHLARETGGEKA
ncbi:mechanosensitive ion channel family protein [Ferrovibrio sp.]|uniref:mechanosensitive ion channel family protein n=1 Tax=Ferrovibrio sp. TaxID=1917215 RepID=UPI003919D482